MELSQNITISALTLVHVNQIQSHIIIGDSAEQKSLNIIGQAISNDNQDEVASIVDGIQNGTPCCDISRIEQTTSTSTLEALVDSVLPEEERGAEYFRFTLTQRTGDSVHDWDCVVPSWKIEDVDNFSNLRDLGDWYIRDQYKFSDDDAEGERDGGTQYWYYESLIWVSGVKKITAAQKAVIDIAKNINW